MNCTRLPWHHTEFAVVRAACHGHGSALFTTRPWGATLPFMKSNPAMLACLLLASSMAAMAAVGPWQWVDSGGRKVYSDRPPPPDIPEKNILRRPGTGATNPAPTLPAPVPQASPAAAKASATAPRISGQDKALEEKKKQAEKAEADRAKAEAEKNLQLKVENCNRAKAAKATLDSGSRIARMNAKGEREFLDDAARAAETKRVQGIIQSDCN